MPPVSTPPTASPPAVNVLLVTTMPPDPIVPVLVTPPLKVVWLITMPVVLALKTIGYGPLKDMERPILLAAVSRLDRLTQLAPGL
jgi:hypothetical protein